MNSQDHQKNKCHEWEKASSSNKVYENMFLESSKREFSVAIHSQNDNIFLVFSDLQQLLNRS